MQKKIPKQKSEINSSAYLAFLPASVVTDARLTSVSSLSHSKINLLHVNRNILVVMNV